jgi:hypothetical protein
MCRSAQLQAHHAVVEVSDRSGKRAIQRPSFRVPEVRVGFGCCPFEPEGPTGTSAMRFTPAPQVFPNCQLSGASAK